jgi:hypothetical protein
MILRVAARRGRTRFPVPGGPRQGAIAGVPHGRSRLSSRPAPEVETPVKSKHWAVGSVDSRSPPSYSLWAPSPREDSFFFNLHRFLRLPAGTERLGENARVKRWLVLAFGLGIGLVAAYAVLTGGSKTAPEAPAVSSTSEREASAAGAAGEIGEPSRARLLEILRQADREEESSP